MKVIDHRTPGEADDEELAGFGAGGDVEEPGGERGDRDSGDQRIDPEGAPARPGTVDEEADEQVGDGVPDLGR